MFIMSTLISNKMAIKIEFDEPSEGIINVDGKTALKVTNNGNNIDEGANRSMCINAINTGAGFGIRGASLSDRGGTGVVGLSKKWIGVFGKSTEKAGVHGESNGKFGVGVAGINTGEGIAIWGKAPRAGRFEGNVEVTGDIQLLNGDCAEDFDVADSELKNVEAGTVMVLTENGSLQPSYQEYDKKVAGILSGASGYKPAIVLDRRYTEPQSQNQKNKDRLPIALMGKVYCKVDARHASIEIGDLLTTSSTKGCAMKAEDPMKAFGAVIGKALGSINEGMGMIPVLVGLQ
jgi:hypothetical protein